MVMRLSVPGKPVKLIGPGVGRWHDYARMAKTIDDDKGRVGRNHAR